MFTSCLTARVRLLAMRSWNRERRSSQGCFMERAEFCAREARGVTITRSGQEELMQAVSHFTSLLRTHRQNSCSRRGKVILTDQGHRSPASITSTLSLLSRLGWCRTKSWHCYCILFVRQMYVLGFPSPRFWRLTYKLNSLISSKSLRSLSIHWLVSFYQFPANIDSRLFWSGSLRDSLYGKWPPLPR